MVRAYGGMNTEKVTVPKGTAVTLKNGPFLISTSRPRTTVRFDSWFGVDCKGYFPGNTLVLRSNTTLYAYYIFERKGKVLWDKPILYLYPTQETEINVKVRYPDRLTVSYPKYSENGWNVLAKPDGTLSDLSTNRELYCLYYEANNVTDPNLYKDGFIIKGEDSAKFLEEKLKILGLNEREAEEFIIYWLPKLESNKYNYIRFAEEEYINENMPLDIEPKPDTLIRVLMEFKGLDNPIDIKEQKLSSPNREGYVAVEWGGVQLDK